MNGITVITGIIGLLVGILLMLLFGRKKQHQETGLVNDLEIKLAVENERLENKTSQINELKEKVEQQESSYYQQQKVTEIDKVKIAELQTLLEDERKLTHEKIALLEKAEENMTTAFENISTRIIEEKSKKFTEQNKQNIGEILNPLREQLGDFRKKIEDVYDKETRDRVSLFNEITSLKSLNEQMSKDAINLTRALKGESKTRGNWGEVILQRVLEDSGLKNGREYEAQESYRDKHGKLFYPDVVVHLPDNKDVVIDSKISLNAYEKFCSSEDSEEQKQALTEHLNAIRTHVSDLEDKNYDELVKINSLDMVLMFVPIEPALMLAFEQDNNLYHDAFKRGIILVSPTTLHMTLRIIHNMWRYEYQNKNAQEIAKRAGDMYDKFVGFVDALEDVGDKLDKAQSAYQTAHNRLVDGKGNLVGRAEAIRKLGLQTNKKLDKAIVDRQSENDETLEITDDSK
ncbi:MAG: DNA recombination protein RmuC [Proteobacteria bacterium]|nr:DNA recombination protein RmuC [Pseudomonadota bacterium]